MFLRSGDDQRLTLIRSDVPTIIFKPEVLYAQKCIVELCKEEVGWVGMVKKEGNTYLIEEIFLPSQGAHGTECEILANGYIPIEEEMTRRGTFDRMFNDLKFWGHSHVNMGVGPSSEDRKSAIKRCTDAGDYFIRCICNKDGKMHLSFFDNLKGVAYENIDWIVDDGVDRNRVREKFSQLVKDNVLPWDVAFPKPKPELTSTVGTTDALKKLVDGAPVPPLRQNANEGDEWPLFDRDFDETPRRPKGVRRRSQVAPA